MVTRPSTAVFKEVPENSGCYQPSEQAVVQADSIDVEELFWALGVVVAKAVPARACFPMRFTKCAPSPGSQTHRICARIRCPLPMRSRSRSTSC